jgi:tungstate transport system permease protein
MLPLIRAVELIFSGDPEVFFISWTSVRLSLVSTGAAALGAVPLGVLLHFREFPGKRLLIAVLHGLMALPTVVVGLMVYSLISRSGPFGFMDLLFRPGAVVLGQVVLVFPILVALIHTGLSKLDPRFRETLITLGAKEWDIHLATLREARFAFIAALLAGFGRVIGEVGLSMMLGGNIRWYTRTITTTIALETGKGDFELALALGIILMVIALGINVAVHGAVKK